MASQTSSRASGRVSRDTGFPEPFDKWSNTTLPHPDADLSPNACISHDELAGDHALKRKRLSFLHRRHKHKRSLVDGLATPQTELLSSVLSLSLSHSRSSTSLRVQAEAPKLTSPSEASFQSKTGSESAESTKKDDETPPSSPDSVMHSPKKSNRFSKWRRS
ncbi:uncharacterized protein TrAtP1_004768 [Trichoderma atroviride]|uniref:Uncharacterized protein n=1 Tax=Hypocrea atroviridis (strain ATCC 20476 / IMI 206040) TaxID=452589 RepID=G9P5D1_HYPAI|nr:uncharacterized protein TRIATDRAFT_29005 [Trichoderma atroviride IMI 206040]EHK41316.1 hypothetical protein TRIATDRAFT_29005 [Trichoderma atroviride IMI 206040]KAK1249946.1 hypothetical protein MKX08_009949 [Trichoderma sp. CBMAI-0020]UKZ63537.1 hypothetical protein TrAtP1_004768 [Trichoderma atroviride]